MSAKTKKSASKKSEARSGSAHDFGSDHPHGVPMHFFHQAVRMDYEAAEPANISKQDYSVAPRHWYIDADFICQRCSRVFTWTKSEQRHWFEVLRLWIDCHPFLCRKCRIGVRKIKELRKVYDSQVAAALQSHSKAEKQRLIEVIRQLETSMGQLPPKMREAASLLERQIKKLET